MSAKFGDTQQITTVMRALEQLPPQLIRNFVLELFVSLRLFTESILTQTEERRRGDIDSDGDDDCH